MPTVTNVVNTTHFQSVFRAACYKRRHSDAKNTEMSQFSP